MCVPAYPQITTYTQKPPLSMICKDDHSSYYSTDKLLGRRSFEKNLRKTRYSFLSFFFGHKSARLLQDFGNLQ